MKINLLLRSHSVTKVISNTCLLILIVSTVHILSIFSSFDSHISDTSSIAKLTELKMSTLKLKYSLHDRPQDVQNILADVERSLVPTNLLQSSWFNTQSLNQKSIVLLKHWQAIKLKIANGNFVNSQDTLSEFTAAINVLIEQHQILANKKMSLVHFIELLEFLVIACTGGFLFYYSKKHITQPVEKLLNNAKAIKEHHFTVNFPNYKNELGALSQGMAAMSKEIQTLIEDMQSQVQQKTLDLEKANQTIEFLFLISQQLGMVKLTSPILSDALNALAKQANLQKLCLELNNGTFVNSSLGCAAVDPDLLRIPIIINGRPYGFINYVVNKNEPDHSGLIESFTGLVARALYQEEHSLQAQKILLMEERSIIARELHDSLAQSLSFLKIQCTLLHRQVNDSQQQQAIQTITNIESAVSDAYKQLRSLLSTFRLNVPESNFKEAILTMIKTLQKQTSAVITIKQFATHFYTDASQHIHLLQIIREAVINAIKHAQCEHICISCIVTDENNVWISITDDGQGISDDPQQENHYGQAIMKQRANELGASLSFNRLIKGTEVKLIFPYKKQLINQGCENV